MAAERRTQWQQDDSDDDSGEEAGAASSASSSSSSSPRLATPTGYAQFQGESDEEGDDDDSDDEAMSESGEEGTEDGEDSDLEADQKREDVLRKKMASVPFGALVKAQHSVATASDEDISDIEEDEWATDRAKAAQSKSSKRVKTNESSAETHEEKRRLVKERLAAMRTASSSKGDSAGASRGDDAERERQRREYRELQKRSSKHAPTEMSSRRPVSRKRSVIETQAKDVRDPRFSTLTGNEVDPELFRRSYSFLPDMQHQEVSTLKQALSKLRKAETHQAGPKATSESALKIREERERVERALKRAEAKEAERQRRDREREVMKTFKKDNEERVSKGGKRFYLKDSAKRELMLQDKFSRLAGKKRDGPEAAPVVEGTTSSSKALRKALDKRRRKNAAKERKTMPFLEAGRRGGIDGGASGGGPPMRRSAAGNNDTGGKRKR